MPKTQRVEGFRTALVVGLTVAVVALLTWDALAAARMAVSQRDRIFHPNRLEIARGDTVGVVNDDGELIHHAYVATDEFSFDSGEEPPGSTISIPFTVAGTFTVRCRIHPKMSLVVMVK
jgi:plastocyanin